MYDDHNDYMSLEDQRRLGYRPERQKVFVPAHTPDDRHLSEADRGILSAALSAGADMMTHRQQTHHAHSDDSAMTLALASLVYSAAYGLALLLITGGLLLAGWLFLGGDGGRWLTAWLVVWGLACLGALIYNRWQGLHFSPAGIAHAEIDSRERIALHAIDRHADIIEKRLGLADPQMVDVAHEVGAQHHRRLSG